ncbi:hypothetical protein FGK63_12885 [Ruegeria sediminis]|uniref:Uncharacterized protein n=1 Tax=Ruegeria sediminis TaxID=2583820 RepID=A0ABY2WWW8_9RHOB|nr:hypothetical protein [Ruegeria sediminis]TMV07005.1 hypothetical protein FGK63_12885 [Ruegeria sediminis]
MPEKKGAQAWMLRIAFLALKAGRKKKMSGYRVQVFPETEGSRAILSTRRQKSLNISVFGHAVAAKRLFPMALSSGVYCAVKALLKPKV